MIGSALLKRADEVVKERLERVAAEIGDPVMRAGRVGIRCVGSETARVDIDRVEPKATLSSVVKRHERTPIRAVAVGHMMMGGKSDQV